MLVIGSDHGGYELKNILVDFLKEKGYEVLDVGTHDGASVDYPDIADELCKKITDGTCEKGILVCGTGIGMNMCANKHKGIRAAQCHDTFSAKMTVMHNNANVITMGGRVIGSELAKDIVMEFLTNKFEGGRHEKRVNKMMSLEA